MPGTGILLHETSLLEPTPTVGEPNPTSPPLLHGDTWGFEARSSSAATSLPITDAETSIPLAVLSDDAAVMYQQEIRQVRLLDRMDEQDLGRQLEVGRQLAHLQRRPLALPNRRATDWL